MYLLGLDNIEPESAALGPIADFERLRRLVYTAMTRASNELTLALSGDGPMVGELLDVQRRLDDHSVATDSVG